ncbi:hypothetical protein [Spirosoma sp.]|uniref:hypothetical protein n=1 Tax=Spirosoma sp. TaxID=1899569 RepID=UPI00262269AC|nr:hypothetical protein [Spirosoma sp.]MCX6217664.1 hypothetical protein [Spirosoma sp.]
MLNQAAYEALINLNDDTIIRVYPDNLPHVTSLEYVIMIDGNDLSENSNFAGVYVNQHVDMNDWVSHSEDARFGGDGSIAIKTDSLGRQYTEWRNGDFWEPFTVNDSSVQERVHYYGS